MAEVDGDWTELSEHRFLAAMIFWGKIIYSPPPSFCCICFPFSTRLIQIRYSAKPDQYVQEVLAPGQYNYRTLFFYDALRDLQYSLAIMPSRSPSRGRSLTRSAHADSPPPRAISPAARRDRSIDRSRSRSLRRSVTPRSDRRSKSPSRSPSRSPRRNGYRGRPRSYTRSLTRSRSPSRTGGGGRYRDRRSYSRSRTRSLSRGSRRDIRSSKVCLPRP